MNSKSITPPPADYDDGGSAAAANDDVWMEILVRLPAKTVTRLKLVCKRWLSLISADQFRRLHTLRRHRPQPSLLLRTRTSHFFFLNPIINGENPTTMIPYNFTVPNNPKILSSCNGLLLLQCDNPQTDYYVYNPTIKQSRKIVLDYNPEYPSIMGLNLAFDPSKSQFYKIVCVRASRKEHPDPRKLLIEVYDSQIHTWKPCLEEPFPDSTDTNFSFGVYCNHSIYWKMSDSVYYFDIDKNVVASLPYPLISGGAFDHLPQLQESDGRLYLFAIYSGGESVALWELQEEEEEEEDDDDDHSWRWLLKYDDHDSEWWFLQYYDYDRQRLYGLRRFASLLRFISGEETTTSSNLVVHVPGKIRMYRFLDKSFVELVDLTNQPFYHENCLQFDYQSVYQFGESLALV